MEVIDVPGILGKCLADLIMGVHQKSYQAGALAMRDAAAKVAEDAIPPTHYHDGFEAANSVLKPVASDIRSIDPATLGKEG